MSSCRQLAQGGDSGVGISTVIAEGYALVTLDRCVPAR